MVLMQFRMSSSQNLLSLCPAHFLNKLANAPVILLAGLRLHPAGHIDSVRTNDAHSSGDVFHLQPACENDTAGECRTAGHVPIRGTAGAAILASVRSVKEIRKGARIVVKNAQGEIGL